MAVKTGRLLLGNCCEASEMSVPNMEWDLPGCDMLYICSRSDCHRLICCCSFLSICPLIRFSTHWYSILSHKITWEVILCRHHVFLILLITGCYVLFSLFITHRIKGNQVEKLIWKIESHPFKYYLSKSLKVADIKWYVIVKVISWQKMCWGIKVTS